MIKNRERYLNRCSELRVFLKEAETLPPYMIATQCLSVLRNIFGGKWRVACWVAKQAAQDSYQDIVDEAWYLWQRHIMRRSEDEIGDLIDRWVAKRYEEAGSETKE